jgi:hypothetical protein
MITKDSDILLKVVLPSLLLCFSIVCCYVGEAHIIEGGFRPPTSEELTPPFQQPKKDNEAHMSKLRHWLVKC